MSKIGELKPFHTGPFRPLHEHKLFVGSSWDADQVVLLQRR